MPNCTLITLADAVAASLNAGTFSQAFEAVRTYQPVIELSDVPTLQVSVVPRSIAITTAARDSNYFDCAVDVGVQQKVNPDAPGALDELMTLVEELADHLRRQRLEEAPQAAWVSIENEPAFASEHLDQQRVFTSVLTVTYRVRR